MRRARAIVGLLLALAATGILLRLFIIAQAWFSTLLVTLFHLVLAAALALFIIPFLWTHSRRARGWQPTDRTVWYLLIFLVSVAASGVALILIGQRGRLALLHHVSALALVFFLGRHAPLSSFRRAIRNRAFIGGAILITMFIVGMELADTSERANDNPTISTFGPAQMRVVGALPGYDERVMAPTQCAVCHADIMAEWQQSIHAVADTEFVYARVVGDFRTRYGQTASNWCAGCHSPLRLARNELNVKVADVPQPNVNCMACHSIQAIHQPAGNNGFDLELRTASGYEAAEPLGLADRLVLVQPSAHEARWNTAIIRTPEFCGACHRQIVPNELTDGQEGIVLQDTYGEWQASRYNSANPLLRRTCQDCHMPSAPGLADDLGNKHPSHFFAGGSRDIARINGGRLLYAEQERLLKSAATLSITDIKCGLQGPELLVSVTNSGAGHNLPTGVTDLRQVWLEINVTNSRGGLIYRSGLIDDRGFIDSGATRFGVVLGDERGQPVYFHDIARAQQILSDTTIPAGATRIIRYPLAVPRAETLHVEAKLHYQSVPQNFINHFMTADVRFEQVTMASTDRTMILTPPCNTVSLSNRAIEGGP